MMLYSSIVQSRLYTYATTKINEIPVVDIVLRSISSSRYQINHYNAFLVSCKKTGKDERYKLNQQDHIGTALLPF